MSAFRKLLLLLACATSFVHASAQWSPEPTSRLVNDYSSILTQSQLNELETRLVNFDNETSNQILVVITPTLGGDEIKAVGQRIGQSWGVGQKEYANGLVIIIKSKTQQEPYGDVAILTGYGLEGALPDLFCKKIIDNQMVPHLAEGEYYEAIVEALNIIEPVAKGEYDYAHYTDDYDDSEYGIFAIAFLLFAVTAFIIVWSSKNRGGGGTSSGSSWGAYGGPYGGWTSGDWSSGSSSSGGFGGFGGFGGGSFGGGGASGRF
ncbi:MAG: TPM domain-containing protein [Bacteroidales bacterium]|nr:TPM domain-containing protein [Bacteroidales bacterium]